MRSRLICSLASVVFASLAARPAHAETTRLRLSIEELPRQDRPIKVDAKNAMLPNGARELGTVPKTWREVKPGEETMESARCTDERRGSVSTIFSGVTSTKRIWERDGKTWLDSAEVETKSGFVNVTGVTRVPLGRVADGVYGYRQNKEVVIVSARDVAFEEPGMMFECRISENIVSAPGGTITFDSSPSRVNEAIREMQKWQAQAGEKPKWRPEWTGVERKIMASVSQGSSDPAPMLSLVIKQP